ncbi:MAG: AEC family transporter [Porticoccaceae bacterium]
MNFLLILVAITVGLVLQRTAIPQIRTIVFLNRHVLWIALPATVFNYLAGLNFEWHYFWIASVAWLCFFGAWVWVRFLQWRYALDRATAGCILLTCGIGNTSFGGIPLLTTLYGPEVLSEVVILDQLGSFLVLSTLGLISAAYYAGKKPNAGDMARRALRFPPLICFAVVAFTNSIDFQWPQTIQWLWSLLSMTLIPAALVSVGMQIRLTAFREQRKVLALGLAYQLFLAPIFIWLFYGSILSGRSLGVAVLEAGMSSNITASIVAGNMGLNPRLATAMVSVGLPLSLVTVPVWFLVFEYLS